MSQPKPSPSRELLNGPPTPGRSENPDARTLINVSYYYCLPLNLATTHAVDVHIDM